MFVSFARPKGGALEDISRIGRAISKNAGDF